MTYELAKKLKDAGFPKYQEIIAKRQKRDFCRMYLPCRCKKEYCEVWRKEEEYIPTLSELIEACGKRVVNLKQYPTIAPKPCKCLEHPATWDKKSWRCNNCHTTNKCGIGGNVKCCPSAPHRPIFIRDNGELSNYLKENRWEWEVVGESIYSNAENVIFIKERADTLEEAVAKLWLKLNEIAVNNTI